MKIFPQKIQKSDFFMKIFPKKIFLGKSSLKITFFVARFREEPISRYMVAENRELRSCQEQSLSKAHDL